MRLPRVAFARFFFAPAKCLSSVPGWFFAPARAQELGTGVGFCSCEGARAQHRGGFLLLRGRKSSAPGWFLTFARAQEFRTRVVFCSCEGAELGTRVVFNICEPAGVPHQGGFLLLRARKSSAPGWFFAPAKCSQLSSDGNNKKLKGILCPLIIFTTFELLKNKN